MKKFWKISVLLILSACTVYVADCVAQRNQLCDSVIRLHVVANSDSRQDQMLKLQVRDAVTQYIPNVLNGAENAEQAKSELSRRLPEIEEIAAATLRGLGSAYNVRVSLCEEAFETRHYDTFSLPAGVYSSLRIIIGHGAGHNWWCVVFPSLCLPAAGKDFADTAADAGYSESLSGSLAGEKKYKFRFFLFDCLGKIENFLFAG